MFKNSTLTFDYVFGSEVSQQDLYTNTASPMLKSFLDGYNVTIMACKNDFYILVYKKQYILFI